jgi:hypothetical protein
MPASHPEPESPPQHAVGEDVFAFGQCGESAESDGRVEAYEKAAAATKRASKPLLVAGRRPDAGAWEEIAAAALASAAFSGAGLGRIGGGAAVAQGLARVLSRLPRA